MKLENAIIIALIVIILVLVGAYLFAGHGNSDAQSQGSVINTHPNTVNTDVQTSGPSSGGSGAQSNAPASSDSSSGSNAQQDTFSDAGSASQAPQAGQAEGTYDPTDFD